MKHDNSDLLVDVPTTSGPVLTVIETARKNRPAGLNKPYEYVLRRTVADSKFKSLQDYLRRRDMDVRKFQYCAICRKTLAKGFRLNLFILGYTKGLCGNPDKGVTRQEWTNVCAKTQKALFGMLGQDAKAYIDEFSDSKKFQMRFEAYVAYKEEL
jgi:hypothetical protein